MSINPQETYMNRRVAAFLFAAFTAVALQAQQTQTITDANGGKLTLKTDASGNQAILP